MTGSFPDLSYWLLTQMARATVVLAVAALLHVTLRHRASAAARHFMWTLAFCSLLAMPVLSTLLPAWRVVPTFDSGASAQLSSGANAPDTATKARAEIAPVETGEVREARSLEPAPASPAAETAESEAYGSLATIAYLAGSVLLLVRLVLQQWTARRILAAAAQLTDGAWRRLLDDCARLLSVRRPVTLRRSAEHAMPMAAGIVRPTILVPEVADEWTEDRRRAVLLHELAHVSRHDCLTQLLASIACAIYWSHPGVWWLARRLRAERELACDDRVLAAGAEPRDYAGHLLDIAYTLGANRAPALAVSMARRGQLEGRMLAVLDTARNRASLGPGGRAAAVTAAVALLLPLAAVATRAMPTSYELDSVSFAAGAALTPSGIDSAPPTRDEAARPVATARSVRPDSGAAQAGGAQAGSWSIRRSDKPGMVQLEMRDGQSNSGRTIPASALEGLSEAQLSGAGGAVRFSLRRDAGTFTFDGHVRDGVGGGTYTFAPNPAFPGELEKRGVARPDARQQYEMARHDVGLALVDELASQGYPKPTPEELVRAGHHGVHLEFVREMGQLGYRVGTLAALIKMRDHGVTPAYVRDMTAQGLPKLTADQLVEARDHGVTPDFVKALVAAGYTKLSLEQLIRTRDHGVSPDFISGMQALGYTNLAIEALINTRDHGVTPDYVKELHALGHTKLAIEEIVRARDHGVTADYAKEMKALGYSAPMGELIRARDHGVTPEYVRGLKALGYDNLTLDEAITLRDRGVTPERVKRANDRAGAKLPLDMIRQLAESGGLR